VPAKARWDTGARDEGQSKSVVTHTYTNRQLLEFPVDHRIGVIHPVVAGNTGMSEFRNSCGFSHTITQEAVTSRFAPCERLWLVLRPTSCQRLIEADGVGSAIKMARGVGVLSL